MTHPIETESFPSPVQLSLQLPDRVAIRSAEAEVIVQAAYGSRGGGGSGAESRGARQDGLMETLVTVFATIIFGLGWASVESGAMGAPGNMPTSMAELPPETGYAAAEFVTPPASAEDEIFIEAKAERPLTSSSTEWTEWTEKPLARSK